MLDTVVSPRMVANLDPARPAAPAASAVTGAAAKTEAVPGDFASVLGQMARYYLST